MSNRIWHHDDSIRHLSCGLKLQVVNHFQLFSRSTIKDNDAGLTILSATLCRGKIYCQPAIMTRAKKWERNCQEISVPRYKHNGKSISRRIRGRFIVREYLDSPEKNLLQHYSGNPFLGLAIRRRNAGVSQSLFACKQTCTTLYLLPVGLTLRSNHSVFIDLDMKRPRKWEASRKGAWIQTSLYQNDGVLAYSLRFLYSLPPSSSWQMVTGSFFCVCFNKSL